MRNLNIEKFRVKEKHDPREEPPKEPSYRSFFRLSFQCEFCGHIEEKFTQTRNVYLESDALNMTRIAFEFAQVKCNHNHPDSSDGQEKSKTT